MTSYTQYMIDNFVFSDTCSKIHTPHMPVPMRYTSQHMEQQDVAVLDQSTWTTSRSWLEWRSTNSWRCLKTVKPGVNLWSHVLIYNRLSRERERERERSKNSLLSSMSMSFCESSLLLSVKSSVMINDSLTICRCFIFTDSQPPSTGNLTVSHASMCRLKYIRVM